MKINLAHRPIRSFVKRCGRLTPAQQKARHELWPFYGVNLADGQIDFNELFGRTAGTVLEIGFGQGSSLLEQAAQHPEWNFIGIDVHTPGIGHLLAGIQERDLTNVRVIEGDAVQVLQQNVAEHSLSRVHIYFPDPWPKKRHHKRRLIQTPFLHVLAKKIKAGGFLHCATDWQDYAEQMLAVLNAHPQFVNQAGDNAYLANQQLRPITKFEKRGLRLGHDVWDLLFSMMIIRNS